MSELKPVLHNEIRPVFIIGSYRSGTSVLTWSLGQHPNILPLEETNWIAALGVNLEYIYWLATANREHSHLGAVGVDKPEFYNFFGAAVDSFIKIYLERYVESSLKRGEENPELLSEYIQLIRGESDLKMRWVDGTPENSHYVYGLDMLFPKSKFIHILRNPKQVARSLMHFSTVGGQDYSEEEAYRTWLRLVKASVLSEKALGPEKVLRIHYEDLVGEPAVILARCLQFIGEPFHEDCQLPLKRRLNSSSYSRDDDYGIEANIRSEKAFEREAFEFYSGILRDGGAGPDASAFDEMKRLFLEYADSLTPGNVQNLSTWGTGLDKKIMKRDEMIADLQKEIQNLGVWGQGLDKMVREKDARIAELETELARRPGPSSSANAA